MVDKSHPGVYKPGSFYLLAAQTPWERRTWQNGTQNMTKWRVSRRHRNGLPKGILLVLWYESFSLVVFRSQLKLLKRSTYVKPNDEAPWRGRDDAAVLKLSVRLVASSGERASDASERSRHCKPGLQNCRYWLRQAQSSTGISSWALKLIRKEAGIGTTKGTRKRLVYDGLGWNPCDLGCAISNQKPFSVVCDFDHF